MASSVRTACWEAEVTVKLIFDAVRSTPCPTECHCVSSACQAQHEVGQASQSRTKTVNVMLLRHTLIRHHLAPYYAPQYQHTNHCQLHQHVL
jgi:hypothetical protein